MVEQLHSHLSPEYSIAAWSTAATIWVEGDPPLGYSVAISFQLTADSSRSCDGGPRGYVLSQQPVEEAGTALLAGQGTSGAQHGACFLGAPVTTLQQGLQNAGQAVEIVHRSCPPRRLLAALSLAMAPVSAIIPARHIHQGGAFSRLRPQGAAGSSSSSKYI